MYLMLRRNTISHPKKKGPGAIVHWCGQKKEARKVRLAARRGI